MKKQPRNPHWLGGTSEGEHGFIIEARRPMTFGEKDEALLLGSPRVVTETEAEARKRRKEQREAVAAAPRQKLRKVRALDFIGAVQKRGGVALDDAWQKSYPGQRKGLDWSRRARVLRKKGGTRWDLLARELASAGYYAHENRETSFAELLDDYLRSGNRGPFPVGDADEVAAEELRKMHDARIEEAQQRRAAGSRGRLRRANPARSSPRCECGHEFHASGQCVGAVRLPTGHAWCKCRHHYGKWLGDTKPKAKSRASKRKRRSNPLLAIIRNPDRLRRGSKSRHSAAALAAFREFHATEPRHPIKVPGHGRTLVSLGDLVAVVYRPVRGHRRGPAFEHKFRAGAMLAATPDGKELVLVPAPGRPFRVKWDRGIVG